MGFGKEIKKIQIYEVFEEHIKLGITCLDENYSEEESEEEESVYSDYSFITIEEETQEKQEVQVMQQQKQEEDNGTIISIINRKLVFQGNQENQERSG